MTEQQTWEYTHLSLPLHIPKGCHRDGGFLRYFEGYVPYRGRNVLYFLSLPLENDATFVRVMTTRCFALLARGCREFSLDHDILGSDRFEFGRTAEALFGELGVDDHLRDRPSLAERQAFYHAFARESRVTVAGYVTGVAFNEFGVPTSTLESVDAEDKPALESLIRQQGLSGPVCFAY